MKLGIVGLPNVGKSTLFNCLTNTSNAEAANYPFCTIDPNVGIVTIPDERLDKLEALYSAKSKVPAIIEFVDIAGLVKGASKGEGLGNKFLSHIREVDAIVHVVRCFNDENITHVDGSIDALRDVETINLELIFSDIEIIERRIAKVIKDSRQDKKLAWQPDFLTNIKNTLEEGKSIRGNEYSEDELTLLNELNLLSFKPVIYAANVLDSELVNEASDNIEVNRLREFATKEKSKVFVISAKIEEELVGMSSEEKKEFLEDLGIKESGLSKLITASYDLLNLMSFLTAGEKEVRAWTINKGTTAPKAAGKIHTDFEKGFIRAEVVKYDDLISLGSYNACKEKGLVRMEGKTYVVEDGDIIVFHFND